MNPPAGDSCHGVLVEVRARGLLITGAPGVGKSSLALELIQRGHKLIADDQVQLRRHHDRLLGGRPRHCGAGMLHLRALGMMTVQSVYGYRALGAVEIAVDLVLLLGPLPRESARSRLCGHRDRVELAGVSLPRLRLDPTITANLATLAEAAVGIGRVGADARPETAASTVVGADQCD